MEKEVLGVEELDSIVLETGSGETQRGKTEVEAPAASENKSNIWIQALTDDGQTYYYNTMTGEAQWEKPEGFEGEREISVQRESKNEKSSSGSWTEVSNPDGLTYYYNTETEETSWEKPAEFSPLEEGSSEEKEEGQGREDTPSSQTEPLSGEEESLTERVSGAEEAEDSRVLQKRKKEEDKDNDGDEEVDYDDDDNDDDNHDDDDDDGDENDDDNDDQTTPPEDEDEEEIPAKKARKTRPCATGEQAEEEQDPNHRTTPTLDKGATQEVSRKRKLDNGKARRFQ